MGIQTTNDFGRNGFAFCGIMNLKYDSVFMEEKNDLQ